MAGLKYPWSKKDESAASGVYAGPDYFNGAPMNDVYAGPEFFEKGSDEPTEDGDHPAADVEQEAPPAPDPDAVSDDLSAMKGLSNDAPMPPPEPMFMTVYAGPDYWSNDGGRPAGAFGPPITDSFAPPEQKPLEDGMIYCPNCGMPIYKGKFCSECGSLLPQDAPNGGSQDAPTDGSDDAPNGGSQSV